jgi:hypothetical protein
MSDLACPAECHNQILVAAIISKNELKQNYFRKRMGATAKMVTAGKSPSGWHICRFQQRNESSSVQERHLPNMPRLTALFLSCGSCISWLPEFLRSPGDIRVGFIFQSYAKVGIHRRQNTPSPDG